jgi:GAF domain-containing protein
MELSSERKTNRYKRIIHQMESLIPKTENIIARMSTIAAILYHKMENFSWAGFYLLDKNELIVGPYQGPVACLSLEKDKGVCWSGINQGRNVIVPDVRQFPGHIACDPRSRSEIVIPLKNDRDEIVGVLDIDSNRTGNFDETDALYLEEITRMVYSF